jgi:hypothetical protein
MEVLQEFSHKKLFPVLHLADTVSASEKLKHCFLQLCLQTYPSYFVLVEPFCIQPQSLYLKQVTADRPDEDAHAHKYPSESVSCDQAAFA